MIKSNHLPYTMRRLFFRISSASPVLAALCALMLLLASAVAHAQLSHRYTATEKVGFAFYKLAKSTPDFTSWVSSSARYNKATPTEKIELMQSEKTRLETGFFGFLPESDLVALDINEATLQVTNTELTTPENEKLTKVVLNIKDLPENYFPFQIGDLWVAVVVKDLETLTNFNMTPSEFHAFTQNSGLDKAHLQTQKVRLELKLKPLSIDASGPIPLGGLQMWLMLAEIAEFVVWHDISESDKKALMSFSAPWYVSETQQELLRLYKD